MSDKLVDVRGVIDRSARVATLKELADQGKKKVKVVNTSQITQLISEAVNNVVARRAMTMAEKERAQLVKESNEEFRKILGERESERQKIGRLQEQNEGLARELEAKKRELAEASRKHGDEIAAVRSGGDIAETFREKVEMLQAQVKDLLRKGEDDLRAAESFRQEASALKSEVQRLQRLQDESGRNASQKDERIREYEARVGRLTDQLTSERKSTVPADAVNALLGQVAELKAAFEKKSDQATASVGAMSGLEKLVADKMEAIQKNIALKVENITFKPKEVSVEETSLVLDRIFDHQSGLESNIQNVAVKEEQQGGIGDSLKRLKQLKPGT